MKKIPLSQQGKNKGKFFALVDDEDYTYLNQFRWCANTSDNKKYVHRRHNGKLIKLHRVLLNLEDEKIIVDHINGDSLDNRKTNLRIVNPAQNAHNRSKQKNSKTGFKGVCFDKKAGKYRADITHQNKRKFLGYFSNPLEAAKTYNVNASKLFGRYALLNQVII